MDLEAVRTFAAVVDTGQFQAAADELGITQQAVSKRIAGLERVLGVLLLVRSARGTSLSIDGQAFLPHARELLRVADRALTSVLPGRRALRIDVLNRRAATAAALHAFHQADPGVDLDVVTLPDADVDAAVVAVAAGTIDATFRAITDPRRQLTAPVTACRVIDDPHQLLVGPRHPLAEATSLTLADLTPYRIWMPGMMPGSEWRLYYEELARAFTLAIDTGGPSFGVEVLLDELAGSADLATFVGEGTRYFWPESYDLRRIPIVNPTPVYPHSIIWREDNPHPALAAFLHHLRSTRTSPASQIWVPPWAESVRS
ncbi:DNA-binding transcriptional LysR family regulator [Kribbella voronezhensis]|uniref:DNA-binding transcriptional LysR family regulator n=1 Tax=Kribbella voronezhensis TaxID=2512212 RepID=A0A4R7TFC4_9ACTN|nr:LysR family transcriptional regulator [Kribbella voronezhensis]TDU90138.1 DNA-binding transcriptional LysR family regulator [Kribbella voronezhensis]